MGGRERFALFRFVRLDSPLDTSARACARKDSLQPKSPVPISAAFLKKFLRELLMVRSPNSLSVR
jgi:hypothetical protein